MKKKTYFKPETTCHALYMEDGMMIKNSGDNVTNAGSDDDPETTGPDSNDEYDTWGQSHRRDIGTSW